MFDNNHVTLVAVTHYYCYMNNVISVERAIRPSMQMKWLAWMSWWLVNCKLHKKLTKHARAHTVTRSLPHPLHFHILPGAWARQLCFAVFSELSNRQTNYGDLKQSYYSPLCQQGWCLHKFTPWHDILVCVVRMLQHDCLVQPGLKAGLARPGWVPATTICKYRVFAGSWPKTKTGTAWPNRVTAKCTRTQSQQGHTRSCPNPTPSLNPKP